MAGVVRMVQGSVFRRSITLSYGKNVRIISTSKKNRETVSVAEPTDKSETTESTIVSKKNWVSYGYDFKRQEDDTNAMHSTFFFSITLCIVFGGFVFTYYPDVLLRDWAQREAYLELRRREAQGLPPIDRNLIDPQKIVLPSDEELADTDIII
ncbi:NADH dehydrogenase [ubiquinone] 1 beta subcomplex subunit 11, mitochondrial [Zootermopsis nevadensis]|uniref:NADH dehydrogenase [ubiquinone] 1 beta subcomplex subunit 11, mitochondrial n=1 Tax=Zootermopsis nevadensis TaxID=136037 RepID=A0A067RH50_ZOONE|nr:NADH dehydrogenase [ubiquinone] 1 beta subcomplex subunit 11, mitochondrial [Zootermopsis nevadensis]